MSFVIIAKPTSPYKAHSAEILSMVPQTVQIFDNDQQFNIRLSDTYIDKNKILHIKNGPFQGNKFSNFKITDKEYYVRIQTLSGYKEDIFSEKELVTPEGVSLSKSSLITKEIDQDIENYNEDIVIEEPVIISDDIDDDIGNEADIENNYEDPVESIEIEDMNEVQERKTGYNESYKIWIKTLSERAKLISNYISDLLQILYYDEYIEQRTEMYIKEVLTFLRNPISKNPIINIKIYNTKQNFPAHIVDRLKILCLAVIYVDINKKCDIPSTIKEQFITNNSTIYSPEYIVDLVNNTKYICGLSITKFKCITSIYYCNSQNRKLDIDRYLRIIASKNNNLFKEFIQNIFNEFICNSITKEKTNNIEITNMKISNPKMIQKNKNIIKFNNKRKRSEVMKKIEQKKINDPTSRIIQNAPITPVLRGKYVTDKVWYTPGLYNSDQTLSFQDEGKTIENKIKDKILKEIYLKNGTYFSLEDIYSIIKNVLQDKTTKKDVIALLGFDVDIIQKSLISFMIKDIEMLYKYYINYLNDLNKQVETFTIIKQTKQNIRDTVVKLTICHLIDLYDEKTKWSNDLKNNIFNNLTENIKDEIKSIITLVEIGYLEKDILSFNKLSYNENNIEQSIIQTYLPLFKNIIEKNRLDKVEHQFQQLQIDQKQSEEQKIFELAKQAKQLNLNKKEELLPISSVSLQVKFQDSTIYAQQNISKLTKIVIRMIKNRTAKKDIYSRLGKDIPKSFVDDIGRMLETMNIKLKGKDTTICSSSSSNMLRLESILFIIQTMQKLYNENNLQLPILNEDTMEELEDIKLQPFKKQKSRR